MIPTCFTAATVRSRRKRIRMFGALMAANVKHVLGVQVQLGNGSAGRLDPATNQTTARQQLQLSWLSCPGLPAQQQGMKLVSACCRLAIVRRRPSPNPEVYGDRDPDTDFDFLHHQRKFLCVTIASIDHLYVKKETLTAPHSTHPPRPPARPPTCT